jgi:hypothetical protein
MSFQEARDRMLNILDPTVSLEDNSVNAKVEEDIVVKLWNILAEHVDLSRVDTGNIKLQLDHEFERKWGEQKALINKQINKFVGQMEPPSKITERIYLGSEWNSSHIKVLTNLKISFIINLSSDSPNYFPDHFQYKNIPMKSREVKYDQLYKYLQEMSGALEQAQSKNHVVLIHSRFGSFRSAALVIAFLMKQMKWDLIKAYKHIQICRPFIHINRVLMGFLKEVESSLGNGTAVPDLHKKSYLSVSEQYAPISISIEETSPNAEVNENDADTPRSRMRSKSAFK